MKSQKFFLVTVFAALVLFLVSCNDHSIDSSTSAISSGPTVPDPSIHTIVPPVRQSDSRGNPQLSFGWYAASDATTPADQLVYQICYSDADPAFGSFSTLEQVSAGTCSSANTQTRVATLTLNNAHAYFINIIVTNSLNQSAVYFPKGEFADNSQVAYYPLENNLSDVIGTDTLVAATFSSSSANVGSGTTDRNGLTNMAYTFTGSSSSQCLMSNADVSSGMTSSNPRTLAFWMKPEEDGYSIPVSMGHVIAGGTHFGLQNEGTWAVWLWGGDPASTQGTGLGEWQYWTITYDGGSRTAPGDGIIAYKNGAPVAWRSTFNGTPPNTNSGPIYIGCGIDGGPALQGYFNGSISGVRLFTRMLCGAMDCSGRPPPVQDEVLNLYRVQATSEPSGVSIVSDDSDGIGQIAFDSSSSTFTYSFPEKQYGAASSTAKIFNLSNQNSSTITLGNVTFPAAPSLDCTAPYVCPVSSAASLDVNALDTCSGQTLAPGQSCYFTMTEKDTNLSNNSASEGGFSDVPVTVPYTDGSSSSEIELDLGYGGIFISSC